MITNRTSRDYAEALLSNRQFEFAVRDLMRRDSSY